jgi:glutamine cyclotransferase
MMKNSWLLVGLLCISILSCKPEPKPEEKPVDVPPTTPVINFNVSGIIPHSTTYFTEGFLVYNGTFLESTGSPEEIKIAESLIATVDMSSGKTEEKIRLDKSKYFGEGIVVINDKLYQLTYQNRIGFIYNAKTFKKEGEFAFNSKEGWGMTTDGKHAIMSDGTSKLTYLLPPDMKAVKSIDVTENGYGLGNLNELEWIKGYIYANIWQSNLIVKIDPSTGKVVGKMDLTSLKNEANATFQYSEVMNGIAYDSVSNKVYVTGKFWPNIYRIEFER